MSNLNALTVVLSAPQAAGMAKAFLSAVVPWPVNNTGYVNLHYSVPNLRTLQAKDIVTGKPYQDIEQFISFTQWALGQSNFKNMWFCTSLQSHAGKNGKAVRSSANALGLKSIWIDIDVRPDDKSGQHYTTMADATAAFVAFRTKVGLPFPSYMVKTGGGLHIYWANDTLMTTAEWEPYAYGLKALMIREELKADYGLTTDNCRLLRVPGTLNHKYNPPRPVELVQIPLRIYNFATDLAMLPPEAHTASMPSSKVTTTTDYGGDFEILPIFKGIAFAPLIAANDLGGGILQRRSPPLDPGPVFEKCGFMQRARDTGGADYNNPLWMYSVLCSTFLENGNEIAHEISKGHSTYTHAETQEMYERKLADRTERGVGWPNCATIHGAGCKSCATCPFLAQGKSPLHLTGPFTATVNPAGPAPATWLPADLSVTFSNIRHRRTLYGYDLVRGEITVLGSPGGVGKSSLAIGMGVSVASGQELLGEKLRGSNLKVLYINAEDSTDEIRRRVWAFCLAHNVAAADVSRLYVTGADHHRVQGLSFLRTNQKGHSEVDAAGMAQLRAGLSSLSPDVIILDPLVALCGSGNMNDNPSMSLVMRALKSLGAEFDCAVLIVHHTRKNAEAGTADAVSGAASIVNLARRAIMPVTLTTEEATTFGVLPSERLRYFKVTDAKSNLAPRSSDTPFYRLHSVPLPNAEPPTYPFGDNVQAVIRVQLPLQAGTAASRDDEKIRQAVLDIVKRGKVIDGKVFPYSPSSAGADNARSLLEDAVADAKAATAARKWAAGDLEAVVKAAIKTMQKDGTLVIREITDKGRFRRGRGLHVSPSLTTDGGIDAIETERAAESGGQLVNSRSID